MRRAGHLFPISFFLRTSVGDFIHPYATSSFCNRTICWANYNYGTFLGKNYCVILGNKLAFFGDQSLGDFEVRTSNIADKANK
jgi:hypothetical protein